MKRIAFLSIGLLFVATSAHAAASWTTFGVTVSPKDAPKVVAATDKLMSSEAGKQFPGKLLLQANVANGADPTTHTFVPIYKSVADREAFVQKLQADKAWEEFTRTNAELSVPVSQILYQTVKNWGDVNDTDNVWAVHALTVRDPAALVAAAEAFLASETGKTFPGQVYLSAVVAGGMTPVTHVISVGYASEAEMAQWMDVRNASQDWQKYLDASGKAADFLGTSLARTVKSWGPATLSDLVAP